MSEFGPPPPEMSKLLKMKCILSFSRIFLFPICSFILPLLTFMNILNGFFLVCSLQKTKSNKKKKLFWTVTWYFPNWATLSSTRIIERKLSMTTCQTTCVQMYVYVPWWYEEGCSRCSLWLCSVSLFLHHGNASNHFSLLLWGWGVGERPC